MAIGDEGLDWWIDTKVHPIDEVNVQWGVSCPQCYLPMGNILTDEEGFCLCPNRAELWDVNEFRSPTDVLEMHDVNEVFTKSNERWIVG